MRNRLYKRIFLNFVLVIALFGVLGAALGALLINRYTLSEAQRRVSLDLRSAWSVMQGELDQLRLFVGVLGTGRRVAEAYESQGSAEHRAALESARRQCGFDFLSLTDAKGEVIYRTLEPYHTGDFLLNDPFIGRALKGQPVAGFTLLGSQRLKAEGGDLEERSFVVFEPTPKAKPRAKASESAGMALVAAAPVLGQEGAVLGCVYAGVLLNRNHALVDRIRSIVFEDKLYAGRHLGTVTIFQWDARIATNVTNAKGHRAIGTRVSADVFDKVLENGLNWYDRAFVVNDWYLSAYDPIPDLQGRPIGILYVGVLARQYDDLKRSLFGLYALVSLGVAAFVLCVGLLFSRRLTGSLSRLARAAGRIAEGDLNLRVPEPSPDDEILDLTRSFNAMAASLADREERLKEANAELARANGSLQRLNASYLDMLGFVSHELKNTLGVIYTSARALDRGLLGPLSASQGALVGNIARNIDSAVVMTRNYLDLARIEQGELRIAPGNMDMVKDVVDPVLEELKGAFDEKGLQVHRDLPERIPLQGDADLLRIAYKNLLNNAVKFGTARGRIKLGFAREAGHLRFDVWNDGRGIAPEQIPRLFEKFARSRTGEETSRSTGLGLFITKEIVTKHGGRIWAESQAGAGARFSFSLPA